MPRERKGPENEKAQKTKRRDQLAGTGLSFNFVSTLVRSDFRDVNRLLTCYAGLVGEYAVFYLTSRTLIRRNIRDVLRFTIGNAVQVSSSPFVNGKRPSPEVYSCGHRLSLWITRIGVSNQCNCFLKWHDGLCAGVFWRNCSWHFARLPARLQECMTACGRGYFAGAIAPPKGALK